MNTANHYQEDTLPELCMFGDDLSELRGKTKQGKGERMTAEQKRAAKLYRKNRNNKRQGW